MGAGQGQYDQDVAARPARNCLHQLKAENPLPDPLWVATEEVKLEMESEVYMNAPDHLADITDQLDRIVADVRKGQFAADQVQYAMRLLVDWHLQQLRTRTTSLRERMHERFRSAIFECLDQKTIVTGAAAVDKIVIQLPRKEKDFGKSIDEDHVRMLDLALQDALEPLNGVVWAETPSDSISIDDYMIDFNDALIGRVSQLAAICSRFSDEIGQQLDQVLEPIRAMPVQRLSKMRKTREGRIKASEWIEKEIHRSLETLEFVLLRSLLNDLLGKMVRTKDALTGVLTRSRLRHLVLIMKDLLSITLRSVINQARLELEAQLERLLIIDLGYAPGFYTEMFVGFLEELFAIQDRLSNLILRDLPRAVNQGFTISQRDDAQPRLRIDS